MNEQIPKSQSETVNEVVIRDIDKKDKNTPFDYKKIIIVAVIVALGTATGYLLSSTQILNKGGSKENVIHSVVKTDKIEGSTDTKTFRDKAEGKIEKGGIDGEGSHKLIRDPKRPDQNVYLTSSVVDLDQYVGKKVRVWGETFTAQKAGWLMDVGKVEQLQ